MSLSCVKEFEFYQILLGKKIHIGFSRSDSIDAKMVCLYSVTKIVLTSAIVKQYSPLSLPDMANYMQVYTEQLCFHLYYI